MASPATYSVGYNFQPTDSVFVIDDGTVKAGAVVEVEIRVMSAITTIKYWILVESETVSRAFYEEDVFSSCRSAPGYQDAVYLTTLEGSPSPVAIDALGSPVVPLPGSPAGSPPGSPAPTTYSATVLVDGTTPVGISHVVAGGETFADLVAEMNTQLGALATATLYQNNIRITSATKGLASSISIVEGSPTADNYFRLLNYFTGLAAQVDGLGEGAIEELGNRTCAR
jgi:hypothetical protein